MIQMIHKMDHRDEIVQYSMLNNDMGGLEKATTCRSSCHVRHWTRDKELRLDLESNSNIIKLCITSH